MPVGEAGLRKYADGESLLGSLARLGFGMAVELASLGSPSGAGAAAASPVGRVVLVGVLCDLARTPRARWLVRLPSLATGRGRRKRIEDWKRLGEEEELACRALVRAALSNAVDEILGAPASKQALRRLVDEVLVCLPYRSGLFALVDEIVEYLRRQPDLLLLVDRVVEYLVHHPEIQALVHAQSASIVDDAVDELRTRAVRADEALSGVVSRLRGRIRAR